MTRNFCLEAARALYRFLGSIRFAMLLLAVIIVATVAGTLIESGFNAAVAQDYVYDAPWFIVWLALLCVNLTVAVLVRYPWKAHQWGFVITHGGIVVILIGAIIGRIWGLEGHMTLHADSPPQNFLVSNETLLQVQAGGERLRSFPLRLRSREPSPDRPLRFNAGDVEVTVLQVTDELGVRDVVEPVESGGAPALRLVIEGEAAPHTIRRWLVRDDPRRDSLVLGSDVIRFTRGGIEDIGTGDEGPAGSRVGHGIDAHRATASQDSAKADGSGEGGACCDADPVADMAHFQPGTAAVPDVDPGVAQGEVDDCCATGAGSLVARADAESAGREPDSGSGDPEPAKAAGSRNELALRHEGGRLVFESRSGSDESAGEVEPGAAFSAGWPGWSFRVEEVIERAAVREELAPMTGAGMRSLGASGLLLRLEADGSAVERWLEMGRMTFVRVGTEQVHLGFGFRLYPLDFQVELERFEVDFDPGTERPAGFKSHVVFTSQSGEQTRREVWMNNPTNFPSFPGAGFLGTSYKFSQSSWNPENLGQTTLQVIRDPGWSLKWIGSLLFCAGLLMVFYLKPYPRFQRGAAAAQVRANSTARPVEGAWREPGARREEEAEVAIARDA